MIAKCQISQFTTATDRQMLFYDEAIVWQWSGFVTPEWQKLFDERGPRFFADVRFHITGREPPTFVEHLPEQGW